MPRAQCPPDSHQIEELAVGRVMASRINDVCAKPNTKRYDSFSYLINRQVRGFEDRDPNDQYRERELVSVALTAYESRHGVTVKRGCFYTHDEYHMLGCAPDAVEEPGVGITVHIRQSEEAYEKAVANSSNLQYTRVAQASMGVTGLPYWLQIDYWEDRAARRRRMSEALFMKNPMAWQLVDKMAFFYCEAAQSHLSTINRGSVR